MKLADQCVSLELAKRMKELGWDKRTLFSWFKFVHKEKEDDGDWTLQIEERDFWGSGSLPEFIHEGFLAPTVAELGEVLKEYGMESVWFADEKKWACFQTNDGHDPHIALTEAEARGLMWCWLKENKKL